MSNPLDPAALGRIVGRELGEEVNTFGRTVDEQALHDEDLSAQWRASKGPPKQFADEPERLEARVEEIEEQRVSMEAPLPPAPPLPPPERPNLAGEIARLRRSKQRALELEGFPRAEAGVRADEEIRQEFGFQPRDAPLETVAGAAQRAFSRQTLGETDVDPVGFADVLSNAFKAIEPHFERRAAKQFGISEEEAKAAGLGQQDPEFQAAVRALRAAQAETPVFDPEFEAQLVNQLDAHGVSAETVGPVLDFTKRAIRDTFAEPVINRENQVVFQESESLRQLRSMAALGAPAQEALGTALDIAGLTTQESRGLRRRSVAGDPLSDYLVRTFERIERATGTSEDLGGIILNVDNPESPAQGVVDFIAEADVERGGAIAASLGLDDPNVFDDDLLPSGESRLSRAEGAFFEADPTSGAARTMWWAGLAGDVLVPWEGFVAKPAILGGRAFKAARAGAALVPDVTLGRAIGEASARAALRGNEVDIGEHVGAAWADAAANGVFMDLDPEVLGNMQVLAAQDGVDLDELLTRAQQKISSGQQGPGGGQPPPFLPDEGPPTATAVQPLVVVEAELATDITKISDEVAPIPVEVEFDPTTAGVVPTAGAPTEGPPRTVIDFADFDTEVPEAGVPTGRTIVPRTEVEPTAIGTPDIEALPTQPLAAQLTQPIALRTEAPSPPPITRQVPLEDATAVETADFDLFGQPELPRFKTYDEVIRQAPPGQKPRGPGALANHMDVRSAEQAANPGVGDVIGKKYRVIDRATGQVFKDKMSLAEAWIQMKNRRTYNVVVDVEGSERPVITWSRTSRGNRVRGFPRPDRLGASTAERDWYQKTILSRMNTMSPKEARKLIGITEEKLRDQLRDAAYSGLPLDEMQKLARRLFFGPDLPPTRDLNPLDDDLELLADYVTDAARMKMRNRLGGHRLTPMSGSLMATQREANELKKQTRKTIKDAGVRPERWQQVSGDRVDVQNDLAGVERLAQEHGVRLDAEGSIIPVAKWQSIATSIMHSKANRSMHARNAIKQTRSVHNKMAAALDEASPGLYKAARNAALTFFDLDEAALPKSTKLWWSKTRREMMNASARLAEEWRALRFNEKLGGLEALARLWDNDVDVPGAEDINLIDRVMRSAFDNDLVDEAAAHVLKNKRRINPHIKGGLEWGQVDEKMSALQEWANSEWSHMDDAARGFLRSMWTGREGAFPGAMDLFQRDPKALRRVYEEVFIRGNLEGPEVASFQKLIGFKPSASGDSALLNFVLRRRTATIRDDAMGRLVQEGLGLPADSRIGLAAKDLFAGRGTFREQIDQGTRIVSVHSRADAEQAAHFLYRNGLLEGRGRALAIMEGPDGRVLVSPSVKQMIEVAARYGESSMSEILGDNPAGRLFNSIHAMQQMGMTTGFGGPVSIGYFLSNFLSAPFMMFNELGLRGTVSAMSQWTKHPQISMELMGRLSNKSHRFKNWSNGSRFLTTQSGNLHTVEDLERLIKQFGIDTSRAKEETHQSMLSELRRSERSWLKHMAHGGILWDWQQKLSEFSHAQEQVFRIGVFLDGLKNDLDPAEAARRSRDALYDYSTLTERERGIFRRVFVFYTFMRKNMDSNVKALFTDPSRMGRVSRFLLNQPDMFGLTEEQRAGLSDTDNFKQMVSARGIAAWSGVEYEPRRPDRRLDPRYDDTMFLTSPLPNPEAFATLADLLGINGFEAFAQATAGQAQPLLKAGLEAATGVDPGTGFTTESNRANVVPAWVMETQGLSDMMQSVFGAKKRTLQPWEDPDRSVNFDRMAAHHYEWVIPEGDEESQRRWRIFKTLFLGGGKTLDTISSYRIILGIDPTRPGEPRSFGRMGRALGFRTRLVESDAEAALQRQLEQAREIRQAAPPVEELGGF